MYFNIVNTFLPRIYKEIKINNVNIEVKGNLKIEKFEKDTIKTSCDLKYKMSSTVKYLLFKNKTKYLLSSEI